MDRVGNLENISVGGSVYLYSGAHTGVFSAALTARNHDRGLMQESFVTDNAPSGLVRSYNHKGVWKLRLLMFRLCSDGVQLIVFRPPKRPAAGSIKATASPKGSPNAAALSSLASSSAFASFAPGASMQESEWQDDALFADACYKQPPKYNGGSIKVNLTLSASPISVKKLSLTSDVGGVKRSNPNFSLKCVNSVRGAVVKHETASVIQIMLERRALLEFCGRDAAHVEQWIERAMMISIVHRTFHQALRTAQNVSQYPATPDEMGAFMLSVADGGGSNSAGQSRPAEAMLCVRQSEAGFAIWLICEGSSAAQGVASGAFVRRFFRACFDEAPLLLAECAILSAVEVTPDEHDKCLLAKSIDDVRDVFSSKRSCRVRIERPSLASLGKMFYFNKWCSFINTFCRHYEGSVEDQMLKLPSAASFAFTSRRPSSDAAALSRQFSRHLGDEAEASIVLSDDAEQQLSNEDYESLLSPQERSGVHSPPGFGADPAGTSSSPTPAFGDDMKKSATTRWRTLSTVRRATTFFSSRITEQQQSTTPTQQRSSGNSPQLRASPPLAAVPAVHRGLAATGHEALHKAMRQADEEELLLHNIPIWMVQRDVARVILTVDAFHLRHGAES